LALFVEAARSRGAYPVLLTPIARRLFDESGEFRPGSHGEYPAAIRKLAADLQVPLIDLTAETEDFLAQLGDEPSKPLFMWPKDNTHLKPEGAVKMAGFVAGGFRKLGGIYAQLLAPATEGAGN
jgi:lysophospholipase L1-like esterase